MINSAAPRDSAVHAPVDVTTPSLRVVNEGLGAALSAGILGAVLGLIFTWRAGHAAVGHRILRRAVGDRRRGRDGGLDQPGVLALAHSVGQEWRRALAPWKFGVNAVSVVLVHTILAVLATIAGYFVLGEGFIGLTMVPFWALSSSRSTSDSPRTSPTCRHRA